MHVMQLWFLGYLDWSFKSFSLIKSWVQNWVSTWRCYILIYSTPKVLEKKRRHLIRAWNFEWGHLLQCSQNLTLHEFTGKGCIHLIGYNLRNIGQYTIWGTWSRWREKILVVLYQYQWNLLKLNLQPCCSSLNPTIWFFLYLFVAQL